MIISEILSSTQEVKKGGFERIVSYEVIGIE